MNRIVVLACILILVLYAPPPAGHPAARFTGDLRAFNLPLVFEPNVGQADEEMRFLGRGHGYTVSLSPSEVQLTVRAASNAFAIGGPAAVKMRFDGARPDPRLAAMDALTGTVNYFLGVDPQKWRAGVPTYRRVRYGGVYPGIDVVFYGRDATLEWDVIVAPGSDPRSVVLGFDGIQGVTIDRGDFVLNTHAGGIRYQRPEAYQTIGTNRIAVAADYVILPGTRVGFRVGAYRADLPLVIDPTVRFSTYLGGGGADSGRGIASDTAGNTYVVGSTTSLDFPTVNAFQPGIAGNGSFGDAFITKIKADGSGFVYSTYLGGSAGDIAHAVAADAFGNVYVTGVTSASNFPTLNAFQGAFGGTDDAFVAKLGPTGTLMYSSYLGGVGTDLGRAIAVDGAGNAYVAGYAGSANFPTTAGVFQRVLRGPSDAFVVKVDAFGAVDYSTLIGGYSSEVARGVAVDTGGHAYLTGQTNSTAFPTTSGAYQQSCDGCQFLRYDVFVTKLDAAASGLVYSTYLGGSIDDFGHAIAVDGAGNAYVTGEAESSNFDITAGAFDTVGGFDAFVTKVDPTGAALRYSTYLGGSVADEGFGIAVDSAGNAYVAGQTKSGDFPTVTPTQPLHGGAGAFDGYVTILNATGASLLFSTFLGGVSSDAALAIALDGSRRIYVTGETASENFPTLQALQPSSGGWLDAFVARFSALGSSTPQTDTVTITRAEYRRSRALLRVRATSTATTATLRVYVTATNQLIGTLQNLGSGTYGGQFSWPTNPQKITVRSSLGGAATSAVTVR